MDNTYEYNLMYLCKNAKTPTKKENYELVKEIKNGNKDAYNDFLIKNGKLILKVLKTYYPLYINSEDAFQQGLIGLMKAVNHYDLDREDVSVSTYAYPWIRQTVGRYISDNELTAHIPSHIYEDIKKIGYLLGQYNKSIEKTDEITYLENKTGINKKKIIELMPYVYNKISLNSKVNLEDTQDSSEILEFIPDDKDSTATIVEKEIYKDEILKHLEKNLNKREYEILTRRLGFNSEAETLTAIAEDFNISSGRVRQIESRAIKKLRHPKVKKLLFDYI